MKKFIKRALLFVVIIASIYGIGRVIDVSYGSYVFVERQPYMVMQTAKSITIKWQTPKAEIGTLAYGLSPENLNHVLLEEVGSDKHSISIPKLKECTKYFYSVTSPSMSIDNEGRSFSTLCQNADLQRLWVIGDSGDRGAGQATVYNKMLGYIHNDFSQLNMWLLLGDNAYSSGTQKQFNKALFEPYKELVKRFVPWAVTGNHDTRRWAFYDIWNFPTKGESGGVPSGNKYFYSIDNGNLHIVMLDSENPSLDSDGDMANWLRKDLQANTKPWTIVVFHTPPYTDGGHKSDDEYNSGGRMVNMRENFVPIFDEFGVDLVLNGHSHGYERSKLMLNHLGKSNTFDAKKHLVQDNDSCYTKQLKATKNSGTVYVVCGSSSKLDSATLKHPAMPFSHQKMGSLILEVTPTTLTSKFLTVFGTIADEFTINKNNSECKNTKKGK
ncbi:MAG: serine/threonine protein phosphatase [Helicobacteraceae bacterium CG2_30_36_10]|nr:MAG: serine/threonine protein phosphatase [Helicobacteraceae bacterium CG2_30_36_10]